jgi:hypothetical protein
LTLLQNAIRRFDSPQDDAAGRFGYLLHDAAGSQTSIHKVLLPNLKKNLRYVSGSKLGTFDEKNGDGKSRPTVPLSQKHRTHVWLASV